MSLMLEHSITIALVLGAAGMMLFGLFRDIRQAVRTARGTGTGCGGSCACPSKKFAKTLLKKQQKALRNRS